MTAAAQQISKAPDAAKKTKNKTKTQLCRVNYSEVFGLNFKAGNTTTDSHLAVGGEAFSNTDHRPLLQKTPLGSRSQSHMGAPFLSCLYVLAWRV